MLNTTKTNEVIMITWLTGRMRIKEDNYTREVAGYRCSGCNCFQEHQLRECPLCHGEYLGKIIGEEDADK